MPVLASNLRNLLEKTIITARDEAEQAAQAALATLAVAQAAPFAGMRDEQKQLSRALRARSRQLGEGDQSAGLPLLEQEIAYEQWHRMLFARFLAENNLLIHPDLGVAVTLEECAELAAEEGASDPWELAARYAAAILPGIFPVDDPAVQLRLAPEGHQRLDQLVQQLPPAIFTADDGLGWVYQFWQTKKKKEINESGRKIGAAEIGPVTQLFTDDYMVRFLLENSLGAWWAVRHPESPLIQEWPYLRWLDEEEAPGKLRRTPAAGTFPGWPARAAEVTLMDPCGGSGHFVVAGFDMLRRMRMEEEGLSETESGEAVIRDNLFMLDIDPRCTQLATFNLVLAAWKAGGYRPLPVPNIACSGIAVEGQLADWLNLAGDDVRLRTALERLYELFKLAPFLGSLISPGEAELNAGLFSADYAEVAPLLEQALQQEKRLDDPAAAVLGKAAKSVLRAAELLVRNYTLVATNVPYLARGKQIEELREFSEARYPESKNDLATVFFARCLEFYTKSITTSIVLPQNWLFLSGYRSFREKLLRSDTWHLIARLGPGAFETISGEVVKAILITVSKGQASTEHTIHGLDVSASHTTTEKAAQLKTATLKRVTQKKQLENPDARVILEEIEEIDLLSKYASSYQGITTGDNPRFIYFFWEVNSTSIPWKTFQSTGDVSTHFSGREQVFLWEDGQGFLATSTAARIQGQAVWGRSGVTVRQMSGLPATLHTGSPWDMNCATIVPHNPTHLSAIWCFCSSPE